MEFQPVLSITEQVAQHLSDEIITQQRVAGSRIQELNLARTLGVSRGSVREALLLLEGRHLVDLLPRRGAVVSSFDEQRINELSELYGDLQRKLFNHLASQSGVDVKPLTQAVDNLERAQVEDDLKAQLLALDEFAHASLSQSQGYFLDAMIRSLLPARLRLAYQAAQHPEHDVRDSLRYHRALVQGLVDRDTQRLSDLTCAFCARERKLALAAQH